MVIGVDKNCDNCTYAGRPSYEYPCTSCETAYGSAPSKWEGMVSATADMVEVVRCRDCIHWHEPEGVCLKIYSDGNVSPYAWQDRKPDDFCSYGKKKI